ncbi:MAG: hypothetical protein F2563_04375 [Actinobacteria bacterium]|jgi:deoxycytidylate deaminase|uniref:Unannotated protein n=1 Tax=freshwater metagenome TaxID=449393 RepID=A0A6J6EZF1_9ZZZZ|nr:hypothetical protein [Actinomycetota bacterium]
MSRKLHKIICQGKDLAENSCLKYRHACLILKGKKVVAHGVNHYRSYCNGVLYPAIHAEHDAILRLLRTVRRENDATILRRKLRKYTVVSVKFCSDGRISGDSKPCIECTSLIKKWGFRKIIYIDKVGNIVQTSAQNMQSDRISLGQRCVRALLYDCIDGVM